MPIYKPDPTTPTDEGNEIRSLVSDILVEVDNLERRLMAALKEAAVLRAVIRSGNYDQGITVEVHP